MREQEIERAIRLIWDSLESHLAYTYEPLPKRAEKDGETNEFHKQCVREYAEVISILSNLL